MAIVLLQNKVQVNLGDCDGERAGAGEGEVQTSRETGVVEIH